MVRNNALILDDLDGRKETPAPDERRWRYGHAEPSTTELLADPIAHLLMRADKLTRHEVEAVMSRVREGALRGVEA